MMKIFLVVTTVLTVSASWAQASYTEGSVRCSNGNALQGDVATTADAQFSVSTVDGKNTLVRQSGETNASYTLSPLGTDQDTQQPSFLAFSPNGGYFVVIINAQNEIISILENDRDFKKCNGGMIVVSLTAVNTES